MKKLGINTVENRRRARKERAKEQCLDNIKKQDIALEQTLEQLTEKEKSLTGLIMTIG